MYRGVSFRDAFQKVKDELDKPILFTEFGADAFNVLSNNEDQDAQAYYLLGNWKEIYQNAAGLGMVGNSIGGFTFQFSDGWWKYKQTENLDIHDNNASWSNGGYPHDFEAGEDNMNEEWFGICAKGKTDERGLYTLYPRAAYYTLQKVHQFNPYGQGVSATVVDSYFSDILIVDASLRARGDKAAREAESTSKLNVSELRAEFTTFLTGAKNTQTPSSNNSSILQYPDETGFDRMESYFIGFEAKPSERVRANVVFNVLGNVAENPINEIFYENRGRPRTATAATGNDFNILDLNRVQVYQADYNWNHKYFNLDGFYRTGHYHWGYEGDFFGLYPEANYGSNVDIYNGLAPNGFEIEGKKIFKGLKLAYGPELWWGANPAVLLKYQKELKNGYELAGILHEDLQQLDVDGTNSSIAVPQPKTRRASLYLKKKTNRAGFELGGLWAGQPLVGRVYNVMRNGVVAGSDEISMADTWGAKLKATYSIGRFNWYAQTSYLGLVARGGADQTQTFTGWRLKDNGNGNLTNAFTGFTYTKGNWQIAPNFMWQQPLEDPIPFNNGVNGGFMRYIAGNDASPFVVGANRETYAGEILFTFDPTPATWMYQWDNDRTEDANFAFNLGFVYRHLPTPTDGVITFGADRELFQSNPPSAEDLWEVHSKLIFKPQPELGVITNLFFGKAQPNTAGASTDTRNFIKRYGADVRLIYKKVKLISEVRVNDWGPYDYHRDFNLTYPLQLMADVSIAAGKQDWFILPNTRLGMRYLWRSLDQFSNRIENGFSNGHEWEFRTYLHINVGK